MTARTVILAVATVFIAGFAFLTFLDIARHGVTPIAVVACVVLALLAIGIFGAFTNPPRRRR